MKTVYFAVIATAIGNNQVQVKTTNFTDSLDKTIKEVVNLYDFVLWFNHITDVPLFPDRKGENKPLTEEYLVNNYDRMEYFKSTDYYYFPATNHPMTIKIYHRTLDI